MQTILHYENINNSNGTCFWGDPKEFKDWIKSIEKYANLTRVGDRDIPRIAYQSCTGPIGDFIKRYLDETENNQESTFITWAFHGGYRIEQVPGFYRNSQSSRRWWHTQGYLH